MRIPERILPALAALLLPLASLHAQEAPKDGLTVNLQLLTQGEIRDGGVIDADIDDPNLQDRSNFLVSRARMNIGYKKGGLLMKAAPQYSGIWGQKGFGSFHLHEAWAKYTFKFGLFAQVGRQALSYDDERIIGPNDWAMAAVSHDVLTIGYEGYGHKVHALLAYNQNPENVGGGTTYIDGAQPYKTMQTLWYHYNVPGTGLGASLLFMNLGVQADPPIGKTNIHFQQMLGTYVSFKPEWGDFSASYYRQMGKDEHGTPIEAWMAAAKAQVKLSQAVSLTAGYDYLSGDPYFAVPGKGGIGLIRHDKIRGFSSLYGSHHKFYGMMDFFYVSTYFNGFSPGLQNAYAGGSFTAWKKLTMEAYYHYMATATKLEGLDMTLGHCVELSATYPFTKDIILRAGFSYMGGDQTMQRLKRASSDGSMRWAWLTLIVSPTILSL